MKSLVLLAGCGLGDGSCIEEVILTYLALEKYRCPYQAVAVNMEGASINHISETVEGKRNVLVESARIGRGTIKDLACVSVDDFDCLVIPGGMGLLGNYSSQDAVRELVLSFVKGGKPIATMCAGLDFLRSILGTGLLRKEYETLSADFFCRDAAEKIYYTPAFRKTKHICEVQKGIDSMICKLSKIL